MLQIFSNESLSEHINLEAVIRIYICNPKAKIQSLAVALSFKENVYGQAILDLCEHIPQHLITEILEIDKNQLKAFKNSVTSNSQKEGIIGLIRIWALLLMQFNRREDLVESWLFEPKRPLAGKTPVALMKTSFGREAVFDMIDRMETGDFS